MKKPFSISIIIPFLKSLKFNLKFLFPFNDPIQLIASQKGVIIKYIIIDVLKCVDYESTYIFSEGVIFEQVLIVSRFYFHCKILGNLLNLCFWRRFLDLKIVRCSYILLVSTCVCESFNTLPLKKNTVFSVSKLKYANIKTYLQKFFSLHQNVLVNIVYSLE